MRHAAIGQLGVLDRSLLERDGRVLAKAMDARFRGSTFPSHSSKDDLKHVVGAIAVLEEHGASVDLDKKDPSLPPETCPDTAAALKERIKACERFVLFATRRSSGGRRVLWELSLSDGYKTPSNVAVFPGAYNASNTEWAEGQYLDVYDRIVYCDLPGSGPAAWMVLNLQGMTATELSR